MSEVKLRKFRVESDRLPGPVELVLADQEKREEARVWIEADFPLDAPADTNVILVLHEALTRLQKLAQEAKDNLGSVHYV